MAKTKSQIAADGKARADAFMAKFADYSTTPTYRRRRNALDERQARSLAKDLSGERKGGIEELRTIPGFIENEASIRKENALHLAMMEAKKRSGLSQSAIARRLGMPQPNVSRIEHSEVVSFNTFADYLMACGFYFSINLHPVALSPSHKCIFSPKLKGESVLSNPTSTQLSTSQEGESKSEHRKN